MLPRSFQKLPALDTKDPDWGGGCNWGFAGVLSKDPAWKMSTGCQDTGSVEWAVTHHESTQ